MKKFILLLAALVLFSCTAVAREVTLQWDPNSEPDLSHYVVHWGISSGLYTNDSGDIGLVTTHVVTLPDDSQVYFFAVTAVDDAGLSSDYSNEVNTANADGQINDATTPPATPGGLSLVSLVWVAADGTTYTVEGSVLTIQQTDGTVITVQ